MKKQGILIGFIAILFVIILFLFNLNHSRNPNFPALVKISDAIFGNSKDLSEEKYFLQSFFTSIKYDNSERTFSFVNGGSNGIESLLASTKNETIIDIVTNWVKNRLQSDETLFNALFYTTDSVNNSYNIFKDFNTDLINLKLIKEDNNIKKIEMEYDSKNISILLYKYKTKGWYIAPEGVLRLIKFIKNDELNSY